VLPNPEFIVNVPAVESEATATRLEARVMVEKPLTESVLTTLRLTVAPTAPRVTESELVEMRDTEPTITCDTDTSKAEETLKFTLADVIRMLETVMLGSALSEIVPKAVVSAGTTKETVARRDTAPPAVS
jgi:fructose-bisphosphate aldolase class 1